MKLSDELKLKTANLIDSAEAIVTGAESQGRELTAAEEKQFNSIMAKVGPLQEETEVAVATEHNRSLMRATKQSLHTPTPEFNANGSGPYVGGQPNLIQPKLSAFRGPNAARDAFDSALWLRASVMRDGTACAQLESRRPQWVAAMTEGVPTEGGYGVPPEFLRAIIEYWDEVGATRQLATVLQINSDNSTIPKLSNGPTVYRVGEASSITESALGLERVNFVPKKLGALVSVSSELKEDNAISMMDLIARRMALALALAEDEDYIDGDGTSAHSGILGLRNALGSAGKYTPTNDNDSWDELTLADHLATMALVASRYRVRGEMKWLCSTAYKWNVLDRISLGAGGALVQSFTSGVQADQFAGYEVVTSDFMPTTTAVSTVGALFGNFQQCTALAERQGIRLATSEHVGFLTDTIAIRATVRRDIVCHELGDSSTAGGVVGLSTHS